MNKPRIALAGSVNSSLRTLLKLHEHRCNIAAVLGLHPDSAKNVSGYQDIKAKADELGYTSLYFDKINSTMVEHFLSEKSVDYLFVIGLSQMVRKPLLDRAKKGNIGFHPTKLPKGRGRAAVAWMILGKAPGAATFFMMDEGMDSGPVLGQTEFNVGKQDYAHDVIEKIKNAIDDTLDNILPKLNKGELQPVPQNHEEATFLGKRKPQDGRINWSKNADEVHRLIRATSRPLPGAFSMFDEEKVTIMKAEVCTEYCGVPGRIIDFNQQNPVVACGEHAIECTEYYYENKPDWRIGTDFVL